MDNRKKIIVVLLFIILLAAIALYLLRDKKKETDIVFTQQGETEIEAGDIVMKVWDHEAEDGDTIQVYFKGKLIADSLAILNEPVQYKLGKLSKGEYLVGVKAINEGITSPASAHMSLSDGKNETEFSMDAWIDSAASWKIIVK